VAPRATAGEYALRSKSLGALRASMATSQTSVLGLDPSAALGTEYNTWRLSSHSS